jgi:hypothetical protein
LKLEEFKIASWVDKERRKKRKQLEAKAWLPLYLGLMG